MRIVLSLLAMMVAALTAAAIAGTVSWRRATAAKVDRLASTVAEPTRIHGVASPGELPAPAARYFKRALNAVRGWCDPPS